MFSSKFEGTYAVIHNKGESNITKTEQIVCTVCHNIGKSTKVKLKKWLQIAERIKTFKNAQEPQIYRPYE